MKNSEQGAFSCAGNDGYQQGLTKLEYFAGLAMQGLLANGMTSNEGVQPPYSMGTEKLITLAIQSADELLKQLESK